MIQKLEESLKLNQYNPNTPFYLEYASPIYKEVIKKLSLEFVSSLPLTYSLFTDDLKCIFKELANLKIEGNVELLHNIKNLSGIIEQTDDMMNLLKNNPKHVLIFIKIFIVQRVHLFTVISIQNKKLTILKVDVLAFLEKKMQFSQAEIANEWGIDKDTLSKWFTIYYETNIFFGRKKINLSEYCKIYNDFFILDEDKKSNENSYMIDIDKIDFYNSLALKGKTYSKNDIIEECFNPENQLSPRQYEEARKILLAKFSYYSEVDKFPTSIAFRLINHLRNFV